MLLIKISRCVVSKRLSDYSAIRRGSKTTQTAHDYDETNIKEQQLIESSLEVVTSTELNEFTVLCHFRDASKDGDRNPRR